jgi:GNAT superfamily N-acetyltransferase
MPHLFVREVDGETLIPLRHAVLRVGLPRETASFDIDHAPGTFHLGVFAENRLVTCATFTPNALDQVPAMQLRGMATAPDCRGLGYGKLALDRGEQMARQRGFALLWCNARVGAIPFYEKCGWETISDVFMIEIAGPHKKMRKQVMPVGCL